MKNDLAIFGGPRTITAPFKRYNSLGAEEAGAARRIVESGVLSRYLGCWDPDFYGGDTVQEFEQTWAARFGAAHAVSVNSNTSGLIAAVGAIGVEPGDEVIVSPWTMSATATAILIWNAIPVFADIDPDTFNLSPAAIERSITPLTRAIVVTDIFGQAAALDEIMSIARRHNLRVVEDAAQAPGAFYRGRHVGTVADIGVYSLNYHKHIHTGEGGVCVTDDAGLAERLQLIRNHGEAVAGDKGVTDLSNIIGFNFRMCEVEAAIGLEQLKKLERLAASKTRAGGRLSVGLRGLRGLKTAVVAEGNTHVYYMYPLVLDVDALGLTRKRIHDALAAEGVPNLTQGYQLLHTLPIYQKRIAYGTKGFPWIPAIYRGNVSYAPGICPVAEDYHQRRYLGMELCVSVYSDDEVDLVVEAFQKVWDNLDSLA